MKFDRAIGNIAGELAEAQRNFPPMRSAHEGYAIIQEEVDELWEEIKLKPSERSPERLYKEALQVAAMAMRFMVDLIDEEDLG